MTTVDYIVGFCCILVSMISYRIGIRMGREEARRAFVLGKQLTPQTFKGI
jgi:hypothetical protein